MYAKFWDDKQRALWFRAERSAESAAPREVYNLVTREARVPGVMLATYKVGRPIYTCIYHDGVRPSPSVWRHGAFCVSRQHPRVSCFGNISTGLMFLQPFYESVSAFLQWISNAKVLLRANGSDILDNQPYDVSENRGNETRFARRRVGLIGFPFFKCDEMHLRWVFTVKTAAIPLKKILEFMFNRARSTLYR